jgi:hypothetical protein
MRNKAKFSAIITLSLLSACSTWVTRTDYNLTNYDEMVVTDSQSERQPTKISSSRLQVDQSILIQNISEKLNYSIEAQSARFNINGESVEAKCEQFKGSSGEIILAPKQKIRIDCHVELSPTRQNRLANRDSIGVLEIPYKGDASPMKFNYFLKVEDFPE